MTLQFERKYSTQGSGAPCHVSFGFFSGFYGIILAELQIDPQLESAIRPKARGLHPYGMRFFKSHFPYGFFFKTTRVLLKTFERRTRGRLGTAREDFKTTQGSTGVPSSLGMLQVLLRTFGCSTQGCLRTTRQGHQDYSKLSCSTTKYSRACRMGLPGPTTSVGTRTDYSVGPWEYSACATQHLMAWGARTTVEEYSNRKLYMSCTV
jgi:hypothetical protein